jgi:FkbM family methyltransferase
MSTAKLDRYQITYDNREEYHRLKREIFSEHSYYFETENPQPLIIDAGAHIGMATLYFKKLFPGAKVIALEPHPASHALLEKNIWDNNLEDVTSHQLALAEHAGQTTFWEDTSQHHWFSTAGFLPGAWNGQQKSSALTVTTVPLADFLDQPVECLKMDIEGAEWQVLSAAAPLLPRIKHILVEFHPHSGQSLLKLVELLEKVGFTTSVWKNGSRTNAATARGLVLIDAQFGPLPSK